MSGGWRDTVAAWLLAFCVAVALALWPLGRRVVDTWERPRAPLGAGSVLIAAPGGPGGPFTRAVVVLLEAGARGAHGVVVNASSGSGGPVEPGETTWLWAQAAEAPAEAPRARGVAWQRGAAATAAAATGTNLPAGVRTFQGRAQWRPGQLEAELGRGAWVLADAPPERVLAAAPESLWAELFARSLRSAEAAR